MTRAQGIARAPLPPLLLSPLLLLFVRAWETLDSSALPETPYLGTTQAPTGTDEMQTAPEWTTTSEEQMGTTAAPPADPPTDLMTSGPEPEAAEMATSPVPPTLLKTPVSATRTGTAPLSPTLPVTPISMAQTSTAPVPSTLSTTPLQEAPTGTAPLSPTLPVTPTPKAQTDTAPKPPTLPTTPIPTAETDTTPAQSTPASTPTLSAQTGTIRMTTSEEASRSGTLLPSSQSPGPTPETSTPASPRATSPTGSGTTSSHVSLNTDGPTFCPLDKYLSRVPKPHCACNTSYYHGKGIEKILYSLNCNSDEIIVELNKCFLEIYYFNLSAPLFPNCPGENVTVYEKQTYFKIEMKKGVCGLQLQNTGTHLLYTLTIRPPPTRSGSIANTLNSKLNISCIYPLVMNEFEIEPRILIPFNHRIIKVSGVGEAIVTISVYADPRYEQLLQNNSVTFNAPVYLLIRAHIENVKDFVLVAEFFFISDQSNSTLQNKGTHYILKQTCLIRDGNDIISISNGNSLEVKIGFRMVRFGSGNLLYLHTTVRLCDIHNNRFCVKDCSRSGGTDRKKEVVAYPLSYGPVRVQDPKNKGSSADSLPSWAFVLMGTFMVHPR